MMFARGAHSTRPLCARVLLLLRSFVVPLTYCTLGWKLAGAPLKISLHCSEKTQQRRAEHGAQSARMSSHRAEEKNALAGVCLFSASYLLSVEFERNQGRERLRVVRFGVLEVTELCNTQAPERKAKEEKQVSNSFPSGSWSSNAFVCAFVCLAQARLIRPASCITRRLHGGNKIFIANIRTSRVVTECIIIIPHIEQSLERIGPALQARTQGGDGVHLVGVVILSNRGRGEESMSDELTQQHENGTSTVYCCSEGAKHQQVKRCCCCCILWRR